MPEKDLHTKPGRKLVDHGAQSCADAEILAILLGSGGRGYSAAWLKEDFRYTERIVAHEIVRNERQKKPFEVYHALLNSSFQGFYRALRPERHLTLTFHNPTFKVRNATVRAGVFAGFDYEHIHHQPLGQVSAKAMMQPFGSAQGDFYLRFTKTTQPLRRMEEVS